MNDKDLDILVEMRSEMDRLTRERSEMAVGWERRKGLLVDTETVLRSVMMVPEIWEAAPGQLLVRVRDELGLEPGG